MHTISKKIAVILFSLSLFSLFSPSITLAYTTIGSNMAGCHWGENSSGEKKCWLANKCDAGKIPPAQLASTFCNKYRTSLTCAMVTNRLCVDPSTPSSDIFEKINPATNIPVDSSLGDILTNKSGKSFSVINLLIFIAGLVFFVNTIAAGWSYLLSSGDPKKASDASHRLTNGFIGLIIVLASFLIVRLVSNIIGFEAGLI